MHRMKLALIAALVAALVPAAGAHGASSALVVSQVFAAGGNAGASFTNDFVELLNRGSSSIDLTGWSIQYATAAGTSWSPTALTGSIGAGKRYLVQLGSGGTAGGPLPTPDATGTINLAASGGKVALVQDAAALTCGASVGSCSSVAAVADLVGYGTATDFEGTGAASALTGSTALVRDASGCTDTDANSADFATAAPEPHNALAAATSCGSAIASSSAAQSANVTLDLQPVISLTLERATVDFGAVVPGASPAPVGERVTVSSNGSTGYVLSVHRTAFAPRDLPLGVSASAPPGTQLAPALANGAVVGVPVAPAADLLLGTSTAPSAAGGDGWPTAFSFLSPLAALPPGHYAASITYTVIGT
jgi:Lamin Tail Domain